MAKNMVCLFGVFCSGLFLSLVCFCLCIQLPVNSIITLITARLCSSGV